MRLSRRTLLCALPLLCTAWVPAGAMEITPDPVRHLPGARQFTVSAGKAKTVWNVFEANPAHYKGEGRIIWTVSPLRNPIPRSASAEEDWFRGQVRGIVKALGMPEPKSIMVSTDMSGSSVVDDMTPFHANLNVYFADGSQIIDVIYVEKITRGAGRLIVMLFSTQERPPLNASAEFASQWGARLKNLTAKDWK
ncbi:MAG: hypothetical protein ACK4MV_03300 [Beijerinckiaceae bacterium]